ncbi:CapA family protein [Aquimarina sp. 2201CG5-10]|uniref:CapA family protein n=1 Tax=Aquimarina callyspongiae TaxID=3098150 RepID=UPI002AB4C502|nr:CapA family protein [Aquimarina sp. 2201CG5-10]MDY8136829.1 CapA family protein [Aquimarina sp. 2201CG5-10]
MKEIDSYTILKKCFFILILGVVLCSCQKDKSAMNLLFAGDVILDRGVKDEMKLYGDSLLINSLKSAGQKDFFILNYEGVFTNSVESQKDTFNFKALQNKASLLYKGGVTHVSVANNHSYDFKKDGFKQTVETLIENDLVPLGELCQPKILQKKAYKSAVLSVSLTTHNELLCISSVEKLKQSVENFIAQYPEIPLIVFIHWGLELQPSPENWQKNLAKELVHLGVDGIIGHHPHVVQTVEFIDEKPIFYSVGNYIADAYLPNTNKAYTVTLTIADEITDIKIQPILIQRYFPEFVNANDQLSYIKEFLSFSDNVCALQQKDGWLIKPIEQINFQEETNLWVFVADNKLLAIKKLLSGSYSLKQYVSKNITTTISLHGGLSEIQFSDINNDGVTDILLGISKKVKFDPVLKKRINIYTYKQHRIQPLWLGTKFIHDVVNFDTRKIDDINYLTTLEKDHNGEKHHRIYQWDDFGFALTTFNQINTNEN